LVISQVFRAGTGAVASVDGCTPGRAGRLASLEPLDGRRAIADGEGLGFSRHGPREQVEPVPHPGVVGDEGDALPRVPLPYAHLEVLPDSTRLHTLERTAEVDQQP